MVTNAQILFGSEKGFNSNIYQIIPFIFSEFEFKEEWVGQMNENMYPK